MHDVDELGVDKACAFARTHVGDESSRPLLSWSWLPLRRIEDKSSGSADVSLSAMSEAQMSKYISHCHRMTEQS